MTVYDIARYFLAKQDPDAGDAITNLKLQKLVYYAQGFALVILERPLFSERIKAWEHGPVVPQLWHAYRENGAGPLPIPGADTEPLDRDARELLDEVYNVYGQFSAWRLRELTHQEPPWAEAFNSPSKVITHEALRRYFRTRLTSDQPRQGTSGRREQSG